MRCYWFGELFARQEGKKVDSELMFLSAVLHDLGLTDHASGPHRFEIEGAGAARAFLVERGVSEDRAQRVWDNIALHTWDMNQFRGDTSRLMQRGLAYDVSGVQGAQLDRAIEPIALQMPIRSDPFNEWSEPGGRDIDKKPHRVSERERTKQPPLPRSGDWINYLDKREAMEIRVAGIDLFNAVLAHEHRCVRIVKNVTAQMRHFGNHFSQ